MKQKSVRKAKSLSGGVRGASAPGFGAEGRVTYRDLALTLGISKTTVSRAFTGHPEISQSMRKRVLAEAERLGYRPDPALSALVKHRWPGGRNSGTAIIAYVNADGPREQFDPAAKDYIPGIRNGAMERAAQLGYQMQDFWIADYQDDLELSHILYTRGITGVVIGSLNTRLRLNFKWEWFAHCFVGDDDRYPMLNTITVNWFEIVRLATAKVIASGATKVGFALFDHRNNYFDESTLAPVLLQRDNLIRLYGSQPPVFRYANSTDQADYTRWLTKYRPRVVVCSNPEPYYWTVSAGFCVPEDVGVVGLKSFFTTGENQATSVEHLAGNQGALAVDMVHQLLQFNRKGLLSRPSKYLAPYAWVQGTTL